MITLDDLILPAEQWNGSIWDGGHFYSGRSPSSPLYVEGINGRPHLGIDLAAPFGSPLLAPGPATVVGIDWNSGAGNWIGLRYQADTGTGLRDLYDRHLHVRTGSIRVEVGETVTQGQRIADIGGDPLKDPHGAGASAGPHDHWELLWDVPFAWGTGTPHIDPEWVVLRTTPGNRIGGPAVIEGQQEALRSAGYDIAADGQWGPASQAALEDLYSRVGTGGTLQRHRHVAGIRGIVTRRQTGGIVA